MTTLRLENVSKRFGTTTALDQVHLSVASGEFLVLVGPSGCGKTTLLRLVAGLERPDEGSIYLDGEWVNDVPAGIRPVQLVFQSYALWPHMKVMDAQEYSNLSLPLKVRRWSVERILARVEEVTRRVGLDRSLFGRRPHELSTGQRQRVALARALTTGPRVFLMDEPITNLDQPSRVRVRHEIRQLHQELGTTTIYVTHNMADAAVMADRVAVMREGRILQVGPYTYVRDHPAEPFVREFFTSA